MASLILLLLLFLAVIYLILRFGVRPAGLGRLSYRKVVLIGIGALVFILFVPEAIKVVPVGHALVIFNVLNKRYYVSREGINYILPIVNQTALYDLRQLAYSVTSSSEGRRGEEALWVPTGDGDRVGLDLTCWYRLDPLRVFEIHQRFGSDFEAKFIHPTVRAIAQLTSARYTAAELFAAQREAVQRELNSRLKAAIERDGFIFEGVALRNVVFTEEFQKLERERREAERRVIEAKGKAQAIEIVSNELRRNPNYIKYLYVDKLSDDVKVIISDQETILNAKGLLGEEK